MQTWHIFKWEHSSGQTNFVVFSEYMSNLECLSTIFLGLCSSFKIHVDISFFFLRFVHIFLAKEFSVALIHSYFCSCDC